MAPRKPGLARKKARAYSRNRLYSAIPEKGRIRENELLAEVGMEKKWALALLADLVADGLLWKQETSEKGRAAVFYSRASKGSLAYLPGTARGLRDGPWLEGEAPPGTRPHQPGEMSRRRPGESWESFLFREIGLWMWAYWSTVLNAAQKESLETAGEFAEQNVDIMLKPMLRSSSEAVWKMGQTDAAAYVRAIGAVAPQMERTRKRFGQLSAAHLNPNKNASWFPALLPAGNPDEMKANGNSRRTSVKRTK